VAVETSGVSGRYSADGSRPTEVSVASLAKPRQRRPALVVIGLLFVALAGLAGALVYGSLTTTVAVLAAGNDLEPGQTVTATDLRVVELANLGDAATIAVADQAGVIGRVARGPIPAGTLLNDGLFGAPGSAVPPGMAVVGAALEPGAAPGPDLRAGDLVDVLAVAAVTTGLERPGDIQALVIAPATIWSVERPDGSVGGRIVVSLLVPSDSQTAVAQAAADDRLRLALKGSG